MSPNDADNLESWLDERLTTDSDEATTDAELLDELHVADELLHLLESVWPVDADSVHPSSPPIQMGSSSEASAEDISPVPTHDAILRLSEPFALAAHQDGKTLRLGRFQIFEELGSGRFGVVYRAKDEQLNRDVAIKIARPEVAKQEDLANRFLQEAEAAGRLDHPGIVPVYEAGKIDGHMFYVMPLCRGENLASWLVQRTDPIEQRFAASVVADIAEALSVGHASKIVHRDVKPANIMMVPAEPAASDKPFQPRLLDFGLSRSLEFDAFDTRSSMIVGTPMYMSPEQALGSSSDVGPSSDIFALGAILYEMLVGQPPFAANHLPAIITQLRECEPTPPSEIRPDVDLRLETICLKCLRLYPEDRYANAAELADDLRRFVNDQPIRAKRATVWDHVSWWARKPARIRDAGIAMIAVNLPILISFPLVTFVDANGLVTSLDVLWSMIQSNWIGFVTGLAVVWCGWRTVRKREWALELGSLGAVSQWLYCLAVLFFNAPTLRYYDGNPAARYVGHLLIVMSFSFEVAMCCVGLYAKRRVNTKS